VVEATMANIWLDISSTKSDCIYLVRVLTIRRIVEPVVMISVLEERQERRWLRFALSTHKRYCRKAEEAMAWAIFSEQIADTSSCLEETIAMCFLKTYSQIYAKKALREKGTAWSRRLTETLCILTEVCDLEK
jgi:hypothetical protein